MDLRTAINAVRAAWSDADVCRVAREFLAECGWELEANEGEEWIRVPPETELLVSSAAVVVSEHGGFGDHVEATIFLGAERTEFGTFPVHGVLRLYLNSAGQMITEDRYSTAEWYGRA